GRVESHRSASALGYVAAGEHMDRRQPRLLDPAADGLGLCGVEFRGQLYREPVHHGFCAHRQCAQRAISESHRLRPAGPRSLRRVSDRQPLTMRIEMRLRYLAGPSSRWRALVAAAAAAALLAVASQRAASDVPGKPERIVSLNMCVDELVLRL